MPIYAYRCSACGHAKDVLQRMSDPVLTTCPACSAERFTKQLTAAGFQLKGSGWYVTDFKGGASPATGAKAEGASGGEAAGKSDAKFDASSATASDTQSDAKSDSKSSGKSDSKPTATATTATPASQTGASGGGSGGGH